MAWNKWRPSLCLQIPIIDDNESDRDEAEGDDCELEDYDGDDDDPQYSESDQKTRSTKSDVQIHQWV